MNGLIFRFNQIVIPSCLQQTVITAAHSLGHLGMTKTKQMLREKYWFPDMNKMTENVVEKCYECQLTTKQHRQEPVKMTNIPEKPWEVVSVDRSGVLDRNKADEGKTEEDICYTWNTRTSRK